MSSSGWMFGFWWYVSIWCQMYSWSLVLFLPTISFLHQHKGKQEEQKKCTYSTFWEEQQRFYFFGSRNHSKRILEDVWPKLKEELLAATFHFATHTVGKKWKNSALNKVWARKFKKSPDKKKLWNQIKQFFFVKLHFWPFLKIREMDLGWKWATVLAPCYMLDWL